jgi:tetratricopeptide (TPR) repeat protein
VGALMTPASTTSLKHVLILGALLCFNKTLKTERSLSTLLKVAMVLRANPQSREVLEESIKLCKEAIEIQVQDAESWAGLGTSYLKMFFDFSHNPSDLFRSLKAYNMATNYLDLDQNLSYSTDSSSDIFRNRGLIQYYMEEYDSAVQDFNVAIKDVKYKEICGLEIKNISAYVKSVSDSLLQLVILLLLKEIERDAKGKRFN